MSACRSSWATSTVKHRTRPRQVDLAVRRPGRARVAVACAARRLTRSVRRSNHELLGPGSVGAMPSPTVATAAKLSDAEVLARCPLFAGLADEHLQALAAVARRRRLAAGETLFVAGESAKGLGVVVRGRVKVIVLSPASGREVVLTMEHPYAAVAELVALDGGTYPASAEGAEESELLWLEQQGFQHVL